VPRSQHRTSSRDWGEKKGGGGSSKKQYKEKRPNQQNVPGKTAAFGDEPGKNKPNPRSTKRRGYGTYKRKGEAQVLTRLPRGSRNWRRMVTKTKKVGAKFWKF